MTMMKAAVLHKNGDPCTDEVLSVQNVEIPTAGNGEILVKVMAAAINPIDWKLMNGDVPGKTKGLVGFDVSGIVESIGPNCTTTLKPGDAVYADAAATQGSFAEFVRVQAVALSRKPTNVDFRQAAALPLAALTALQGLTTQGGLQPGQKVAILGGAGGVGSLAIQMAKALGADQVIATGSSVDFIKSLGADTVVNYKETTVVDALKGKQLDLVFDTVGGKESWLAAKGALKKGGKFVTIVGDGGGIPRMIPGIAWRKLNSILGGPTYTIFLTNTSAPSITEDMAKLTEMVEAGQVNPILEDKDFELTTESVHEMVKASMSHRAKGKLVLTVVK